MDTNVSKNDVNRRQQNLKNALMIAEAGAYVFPSSDKTPLIPRYNHSDQELSAEEKQAAIEKHEFERGEKPVHVGATTCVEVVKKMWTRFPDAVPSIAAGPSGLVVIDADAKDNGPDRIEALFAANGGLPEGVHVNPTKSGGRHYVFADPNGEFTNRAGALKNDYGCDVRGKGGQFVAAGSIRQDRTTYGRQEDRDNFLRSLRARTLPLLPDFIKALIGKRPEGSRTEISPNLEREVIKQLEEANYEEVEILFDPVLGVYDIDVLRTTNPDFRKLYDKPSNDCSMNRFLAARFVMCEWPDMTASALAAFFDKWSEGAGRFVEDKPSAGEYDYRQVAREWLKNCGLSKHSDGSAFDAVEDEEAFDRVVVKVSLNNPAAMVHDVERVLLQNGAEIYRRGKTLVEVVTDKPLPGFDTGTPTAQLLPVNVERLGQLTGSLIDFRRYNARAQGFVSCPPPRDLMNHLIARGVRSQIRRVDSVVATPLVRHDGTVLSSPGYDAATEIYLAGGLELPDMPSTPTRDQGRTAIAQVAELFSEVAFADRGSGCLFTCAGLSAVLSVLLGGVARLLANNVPMLAVKAATPGSGKSYIGRMVGLMLTGRDVPVTSVASGSSGELEKRLNAALLGGTPMIHLDNCNGRLESDLLCQVLTERTVTIRPLGLSEEVTVSGMPVVLANGNNLLVDDNLARRTLLVELDAGMERPELRSFNLRPLEMLSKKRGSYLAALLTAVQAYLFAVRRGEAKAVTPSVGSFQGWSDCARSALLWYGYADPVEAMTIAQAEDPDKAARRAIFRALQAVWGDQPFTASDILERLATANDNFALDVNSSEAELCINIGENLKALVTDHRKLSGHSLGVLLREWNTKVESGLKLVRLDRNSNNVTTYCLKAAA